VTTNSKILIFAITAIYTGAVLLVILFAIRVRPRTSLNAPAPDEEALSSLSGVAEMGDESDSDSSMLQDADPLEAIVDDSVAVDEEEEDAADPPFEIIVEDDRLPVPSEEVIQLATQNIRQLYSEDIMKAGNDPVELYFLSTLFHRKAAIIQIERMPGRPSALEEEISFWLLAATTAAQGGNSRSIRNIARILAGDFQLDESYVFEHCQEMIRVEGNSSQLIAYDLVEASEIALRDGNPDLALQLLDVVENAIVNSARNECLPEVVSRRPMITEIAEYAEQLDIKGLLANELLDKHPEDEKLIGWFLCYQCGNWEKGLPHLAISNAPEALVAQKEVLLPDDCTADELRTLADSWWDVAESKPVFLLGKPISPHIAISVAELQSLLDDVHDIRVNNIRGHAVELYEKALLLSEEPPVLHWSEAVEALVANRIEEGRLEELPFRSLLAPPQNHPLNLDCRLPKNRAERIQNAELHTTDELRLQLYLESLYCMRGGVDRIANSSRSTGTMAITLLPLLVEYPSHLDPELRSVVDEGIRYILKRGTEVRSVKPAVSFFDPNDLHLHSHQLATIAICEYAALLQDPRGLAIGSAAVEFISRIQNDDGGWGFYPAHQGGAGSPSDMRSFALNVMALSAAQHAGVTIPAQVRSRAERYLLSLAIEAPVVPAPGNVEPGANDASNVVLPNYLKEAGFPYPDRASTAIGVLCEILLDKVRDPEAIDAYILDQLTLLPPRDPFNKWATTWLIVEWAPEYYHEWRSNRHPRTLAIVNDPGVPTRIFNSKYSFVPGEDQDEHIRLHTACIGALLLQAPYRYPSHIQEARPQE
jgi:hypothetical protein